MSLEWILRGEKAILNGEAMEWYIFNFQQKILKIIFIENSPDPSCFVYSREAVIDLIKLLAKPAQIAARHLLEIILIQTAT